MLPGVEYTNIKDDFCFSLVELEADTMRSCIDFLKALKPVIIEENLMQDRVIMVAYLCAYLGTVTTVHVVDGAGKLEPAIIDIIKHQADEAFKQFEANPVNSTVLEHEEKVANLEVLRQKAPGSIVAQTVRLGRRVIDMLEDITDNYRLNNPNPHKVTQTELFCSQDKLIKILLAFSSKSCVQWRKSLDGLSDNYVINQLAIQIGWLIGYFSHLQSESPEKARYFDYGLPLVEVYSQYVYQLMESFAEIKASREAELEEEETESLLNDVHELSVKTNAQRVPAVNEYQKQLLKAHASIESTLLSLVKENFELKIINMSLFYFWFNLEAPMQGVDRDVLDSTDVLSHFSSVVELVKSTVSALPEPEFSDEVKELHCNMEKLKARMPHPKVFDDVEKSKAAEQTATVNEAIYKVTCDLMKKEFHLEAVSNALFNHWLRCSVFFGVTEKEWQKMDYYQINIMQEVRRYLQTISH